MSASPLLALVAASALAVLCSAADGSLVAPTAADIDERARATTLGRREQTHRALTTARVFSYLTAGAALARSIHVERRATVGAIVLVVLLSLLLIAVAEGAARAAGYARPDNTARRLGWLVRAVRLSLSPVVALGSRGEALLDRIVPMRDAEEDRRETSAAQFREVVTAEADVTREEEALIHGVFSLGNTEVREIMVPRVDIVGIEAGIPWSEVVDRVRSSEHARFPVFEETLDNMVGILYAKDLLPSVIEDEEPRAGWRSLIRPAVFIPTSKIIDDQLRDFKASHTHIAIVSDEYGGTAGLVTIEDVLEEIVGDIRDEYDVEPPEIEREGDSHFWIAGKVTVDELSELLDTRFDVDDVTTVGGLVYELFGRVPRPGESIVAGGYRIVVEQVRHRRIERVYFERMAPVARRWHH